MREIKFRAWRKSYINIYKEELNEFRKTPENQKLRKEMMRNFVLAGARQFDVIIKEKFEKMKGIKYEDGRKEIFTMDYNPKIYGEESYGEWDIVEINEGIKETEDIFLQYTGIKDKNGKEIYEGDIVEYHIKKDICTVKWDNKQCGYMVNHKDVEDEESSYSFRLTADDISFIEVIGNIYENPELLEGK